MKFLAPLRLLKPVSPFGGCVWKSPLIPPSQVLTRRFCKNASDDEKDAKEDPEIIRMNREKSMIQPSLKEKFEIFDTAKPTTILDYHEELYGLRWDDKHKEKEMDTEESFYLYRQRKTLDEKVSSFSTARGVQGVFDPKDLVLALRSERLTDIAVIRVPPEAHYCDYLVLCTARNRRHLDAALGFIRKLHKVKKSPRDPHLNFTIGEKDNSSWLVLDMGYIVVHFFLPKVREVYDLESLWSVGPQYDEKTVRPVFTQEVDIMEKHVKFIESLVPDSDQAGKGNETTTTPPPSPPDGTSTAATPP